MVRIAAQPIDTKPVVRRMRFDSDASPRTIADEMGCATAAIVQLLPFFVDDNFVTVLASATRRLNGADVIHALHATSVRRPSSEEILLGFQLGRRRHTVFMDHALLDHDEVLLCIEPPRNWIATNPHRLRSELGARYIAIPPR